MKDVERNKKKESGTHKKKKRSKTQKKGVYEYKKELKKHGPKNLAKIENALIALVSK